MGNSHPARSVVTEWYIRQMKLRRALLRIFPIKLFRSLERLLGASVMMAAPETEELVQMALAKGFSQKYIERVKHRLWLVDGKLCLQPRLGPLEVCGGPEGLYDDCGPGPNE